MGDGGGEGTLLEQYGLDGDGGNDRALRVRDMRDARVISPPMDYPSRLVSLARSTLSARDPPKGS